MNDAAPCPFCGLAGGFHESPHPRPPTPAAIKPRTRTKAAIARDELRQRVYDRDGHRCLACGATDGLTLDHIIPEGIGGRAVFANLRTLCGPCNWARHSLLTEADVILATAQAAAEGRPLRALVGRRLLGRDTPEARLLGLDKAVRRNPATGETIE